MQDAVNLQREVLFFKSGNWLALLVPDRDVDDELPFLGVASGIGLRLGGCRGRYCTYGQWERDHRSPHAGIFDKKSFMGHLRRMKGETLSRPTLTVPTRELPVFVLTIQYGSTRVGLTRVPKSK